MKKAIGSFETAYKEREKWWKKIRALLENPPENVAVGFDEMRTCLFAYLKDAPFNDREGETPVHSQYSGGFRLNRETGIDQNFQVGDGIAVELLALAEEG